MRLGDNRKKQVNQEKNVHNSVREQDVKFKKLVAFHLLMKISTFSYKQL